MDKLEEMLENYSAKDLALMLLDEQEKYKDAEERLNIALNIMTDHQIEEFEEAVDRNDEING